MAFLLDALHEDDGVAMYDQRRGDSWDPKRCRKWCFQDVTNDIYLEWAGSKLFYLLVGCHSSVKWPRMENTHDIAQNWMCLPASLPISGMSQGS